MARLVFSNVTTADGRHVSGNISLTGKGNPFAKGGKYGAQIASIQKTIASAPKGFYDPVGWDDFLRKRERLPPEVSQTLEAKFGSFIPFDDPEITQALLAIPQARQAMIDLANLGLGHEGRLWEACTKCNSEQLLVIAKKRDNYYSEISLHLNRLLEEKNAPLIQALEEREIQNKIDQAVKIALEQKIRETATPKPKPTPTPSTPTPEPTPTTPVSTISILPFAVVGIVLIGILLFLRSRA